MVKSDATLGGIIMFLFYFNLDDVRQNFESFVNLISEKN